MSRMLGKKTERNGSPASDRAPQPWQSGCPDSYVVSPRSGMRAWRPNIGSNEIAAPRNPPALIDLIGGQGDVMFPARTGGDHEEAFASGRT